MNSIFPDHPGMHIEWVLSNVCNYTCDYCRPDLYDGSSRWPDIDKAVEFYQYVHNNVNSGPKLLNLTGGEPTLWPKLFEFLNRIDNSYYTQITTNGSRTIRWWNDLLDNYDNLAKVCISTHLEFAELEHIINVAKTIHRRTQLTILILASKKNFHLVEQYRDRLLAEQLEINIHIKPIRWLDGKAEDYTEYELDVLNNFKYGKSRIKDPEGIPTHLIVDGEHKKYGYALELISKNKHSFKGWKCSLGKTRLVIWHDGQVYSAQCSTAKQTPLGNLNTGKLEFVPQDVICQTDYCTCAPDIRIPKWKEDV
jgi:organic radical activating enzyme